MNEKLKSRLLLTKTFLDFNKIIFSECISQSNWQSDTEVMKHYIHLKEKLPKDNEICDDSLYRYFHPYWKNLKEDVIVELLNTTNIKFFRELLWKYKIAPEVWKSNKNLLEHYKYLESIVLSTENSSS